MNEYRIGRRVSRIEDARFVTGRGRYIADVKLANEAHAAVLRSPHAAAIISSIDTDSARVAPGVLAVYTAADIGDELGTTAITFKRRRPDGSPMFWRPQSALARDRVRYVGEPVALIVAETLVAAKDAAERVVVAYEAEPAVVDVTQALQSDSPRVWAECPDNLSHIHEIGNLQGTEAAFAAAKHVVKRRYIVSRVHPQFMEPRGAIGVYDALEDRFTLYCDVQAPHQVRDILAREILKLPVNRLRVVAFDIGGAFGGKAVAVEHRLVLWAARRVGRPVRWQADRSETMLSDEHGRDNVHDVELALDADGTFIALQAQWTANVGAYISADRNFQTSFTNVPGLVGVYRFPAAYVRSCCVMTNTGPLAPYRGAGRPEATFVIERLIDDAARELGFDRVELRRKNTLTPRELPVKTALGFVYECGDFAKCMELAQEAADWSGFAARREGSRKRGLLRGLGIANPIERAGPPAMEYAEIRFDRFGKATVSLGTKNHGQGHETTFAQVLGSELGIAPDDITYIDGDTDRVAYGNGTFGSRSASIGGTAVTVAAAKVVAKGTLIAAHLLEASSTDIRFDRGAFFVPGTDLRVTLSDVAKASFASSLPPDVEPGLFASGSWAPKDCTYPYGTHVCEVEVDPETGAVQLDRYHVVDDVGTVINPLLLEGQIHGGIGQGAAQVLAEQMLYDADSGQCLTGSFMDYAMARASDFCSFEVGEYVTPSQRNPLGVKGAGEAGAVGAMAAVMNAIVDALAPLGVTALAMPATPDRVWHAIRRAKA
jgi:aerobic carbon-monoxide dehydrogenase large subunit